MIGTKVRTTQNVIINLNSNVLLWRVLAYFIDSLILGAYLYFLYEINDANNTFSDEDSFIEIAMLILILPFFTYSLLTEFLLNGRTIGKFICGIRVVKINGLRAGFTEYLLRWLFRMIDIYPFIFLSFFLGKYGNIGFSLIGIPAFIMIITSKNHQRLGDRVAGTTVIKVKNSISLSSTIFKEISDDYIPTFPQVVKLSDNDMRIIKDNFGNAQIHKNAEVMQALRKKVSEVMQVDSPLSDEEFLNIVMNDFNHYTQYM